MNILNRLPKWQIEKVLNQPNCDIDLDFLGFLDIYETLSKIIPKYFTVVDLGCAYNPQCFFFEEHKSYLAVDISDCVKFQAKNCEIFQKSISEFINENLSNLNLEETFAICSYVPSWGGDNGKIARDTFKNVFVYYPSSTREIS